MKYLSIFFFLLSSSAYVAAQARLTLQEAVTEAIKNNPSVKASEYEHKAQQALKKTSFDWGKTNVIWMRGQYNTLNQDNNYTLTQSIPFPTVSVGEVQLNRALTASAEQRLVVTQIDLAYQVKTTFIKLQHEIALHQLLQSEDTLYAVFAKAAGLRFKTGESNLLEKTTAETQWMEVRNQLQVSERDIAIEQTQLQTLLHSNSEIMPSEKLAPFATREENSPSELMANPQLNYWKQLTTVATASKKVERNRYLPDITVGYFSQSLIGFQRVGATETFFGKDKRFTGWTLGLSIPLWFVPQAGRAQAASLRESAAQQQFEGFQRQLEGQYNQGAKELEKSSANLQYYVKDANPNAMLILKQSQQAYQSGEIGYVEYLQALKQSYAIQRNYLAAIHQFNQSVLQIEHLLGKK